jgi:peptide/nickel transport system permease protein
MTRLVAGRLMGSAIQLVLLLILVFVAVRLAGDPADVLLPVTASPGEVQQMSEALGLDKPIHVQFQRYILLLGKGDFGRTFKDNRPVGPLVFERLGNSARLALAAALVALIWAIPLGVLAAKYVNTPIDSVAHTAAVVGFAIPNFLLAIILVRVFSVDLPWFPTSGMGGIDHYVLPALALGTAIGAGMMRLMRSGMLEAREEPFIRMAQSKGLSPWVVTWRHQFRAAVMPVLTYSGMYFGTLLGGSVVIEVVFAWPGMGRLAYEAALGRDFPVLQAIVLLLGVIIITANLLVDTAYGYIDPRIRMGRLT